MWLYVNSFCVCVCVCVGGGPIWSRHSLDQIGTQIGNHLQGVHGRTLLGY